MPKKFTKLSAYLLFHSWKDVKSVLKKLFNLKLK